MPQTENKNNKKPVNKNNNRNRNRNNKNKKDQNPKSETEKRNSLFDVTLTNVDYTSIQNKGQLAVTNYYLNPISGLLDKSEKDLTEAINNYNALVGTDTGLDLETVAGYLLAATQYHTAILHWRKINNRRNFQVQGQVTFGDMPLLRLIGDQAVPNADDAKYVPIQYQDIVLDTFRISNAAWSSEYLMAYQWVKLPATVYLILDTLYSHLYSTSKGGQSKFYEFSPRTMVTSTFYSERDILNTFRNNLESAFKTNPFLSKFLDFIGFSHMDTEELLLDRTATAVSLVQNPQFDWSLENIVFNKPGGNGNIMISLPTEQTLIGKEEPIISVDFADLADIILLDELAVAIGGISIIKDEEWVTRHEFSSGENALVEGENLLGFSRISVERDQFDQTEFIPIMFRNALIAGVVGTDILDMASHNYEMVYGPTLSTIYDTNENKWSFTFEYSRFAIQPLIDTITTTGSLKYLFVLEQPMGTILSNRFLFGMTSYPTVYLANLSLT